MASLVKVEVDCCKETGKTGEADGLHPHNYHHLLQEGMQGEENLCSYFAGIHVDLMSRSFRNVDR